MFLPSSVNNTILKVITGKMRIEIKGSSCGGMSFMLTAQRKFLRNGFRDLNLKIHIMWKSNFFL